MKWQPINNPRPRRRFSQNFLHDSGVIRRIIEAVGPRPGETLLEIGPGRGALTHGLAESGARLCCVEIDRDLAAALQARFAGRANVRVVQGDILKFDVGSLCDDNPEPDDSKRVRVVGNLPYHIATPVLFSMLASGGVIRDMVLMLQLEVVQRITAAVGSRQYGRLGLMVGYHCAVEHLFNVPAGAFSPRPKVVSAVLGLRPYRQPPHPARDPVLLEAVIRAAFGQRRKTLKNSLAAVISPPILDAMDMDLQRRAQELTLADYVRLSDAASAANTKRQI